MATVVRKRAWTQTQPNADRSRPLAGGLARYREQLLIPLTAIAAIVAWDLLVRWGDYPPFILPSPWTVWTRFLAAVADGTLWRHAQITLMETAGGLALGLSTALVTGYGLAKSPLLERMLSPYIVAAQAVPVVAVAPLLLIWFGFGALSKVLVCALTIFFPMVVNTIIGIRSVEPDLVALMRSLRATRWQMFRLLEVPAALPVLFGGLKVAMTLAVIGAVVGEFVGADRGLGFLLNLARGVLDTPLLFVALFTLVAIALGLYLATSWLELWLLRWQREM